MPSLVTACRFAVESMYTGHPVGVHGTDKCFHSTEIAEKITRAIDLDARARLSEALARALASSRHVDVVDLLTASPVLRAEVVRDGVVLVERDRIARFDFEMDAIRRFEDTRQLRRVQHDLLREATRGPA